MRKTTTLSPWVHSPLFPTFDQLFSQLASYPRQEADRWTPAIDIIENDDAYEVHAELAGIDPKYVDVSLSGDLLTIRGEKQQEKKKEEDTWSLRERIWGSFERSFTLPTPVDAKKVTAETKNGVLTVTVPKSTAARSQRIEIKNS